jgi:hypothetical protein
MRLRDAPYPPEPYDEANWDGVALFGEKYEDQVRRVEAWLQRGAVRGTHKPDRQIARSDPPEAGTPRASAG